MRAAAITKASAVAKTVRAELVEALSCLAAVEEGQGFDRLSPNGICHPIQRKSDHV